MVFNYKLILKVLFYYKKFIKKSKICTKKSPKKKSSKSFFVIEKKHTQIFFMSLFMSILCYFLYTIILLSWLYVGSMLAHSGSLVLFCSLNIFLLFLMSVLCRFYVVLMSFLCRSYVLSFYKFI
jgi:hypothetical protein